jgi:histidinol-phosphatase (PHP family)
MIDYHVHCDYSIDAEGPAEEYAERALEKGLKGICFTTHCDLDPTRSHHDGRVRLRGEVVPVTSDWLDSYIADIERVAGAFSPRGLEVLCGLEIGYVPGIERLIERTVEGRPLDFIVGGVHTLEGVDIVSSGESTGYFKGHTPRQVCERYFESVGEAVASGLFDCIAHLDIYKRCGLDFYGDALSGAHLGLAEPVLAAVATRDICLEINGGGLRKGLRWPYPSPDLLEAARELGVRHVTLGSDGHRPEDVGSGIARCLESAREKGFTSIATFRERVRRELPIGDLHDERQEHQPK